MSGTDNLLYVKNLRVSFRTGKQSCFEAVKGISFTVPYNKTVALVGESGRKKTIVRLGNIHDISGTDVVFESRFYGGIPDWRSVASAQGNGFSAGENASH